MGVRHRRSGARAGPDPAPRYTAPTFAAPTLAALHRHSEADWHRIFATRPEAAVAWIRLAARSGFKAAQLVLGQMHLDGHGVMRDASAAHGWFAKAAALGHVEARNMVGRCHELGWGVPIDQAEALRHYTRADAGGSAWGAYNVGCLRLYGTGVRRDHAAAFAAFRAAAARDHPEATGKAMGMLGRCHEEGWGTPVDRVAAAAWYARAADGGDCWGAFNLGLMRAEAGALPEAVDWIERAVATATPNCLSVIARTLAPHADPRLSRIGSRAYEALSPAGPPAAAHTTSHRRGASRRAGAAGSLFGAALLLAVLARRAS